MILPPMRRVERWHREDIEETIEALVAELDRRDGDPDFEPDADREPSLGSTMAGAYVDFPVATHGGRFLLTDVEVDDSDFEPSLGWDVNGRRGGGCDDLERDEARP